MPPRKRKQKQPPILDDDKSNNSEEKEFVGDDEEQFVYGEIASNLSKTSDNSNTSKKAETTDAADAPNELEAAAAPPPEGIPPILKIFTQQSDDESKGAPVSASAVTPNASASQAGKTGGNSSSKSSEISSATSSQGGSAGGAKKNKYAAIRAAIKNNKSPKSARKQRKTKMKKTFPPPGSGKVNRLYTYGTQDSSNLALIMHKKNAGEGAFTKTVDDQIRKNPELKEAMGIDNLCFRVDPDNGSKPYAIEYTNKFKEKKVKYMSVYQYKSSDTTKPKREKWAANLIKFFNRHGSAKYSPNDWGEEKFEYAGDIEDGDDPYFLGDFLTNADVANVMKTDFAYSEKPLTCAELAGRRDIVELYYGPDKVDEGVSALLAKHNGGININGDDDDEDEQYVPFDSDDEN